MDNTKPTESVDLGKNGIIALANSSGIDTDTDGDIWGSTNGAIFKFADALITLARRAPAQQDADERAGWEAAAKALTDRGAAHHRNNDFDLADEVLQCASMLHDLKPARATQPVGQPAAGEAARLRKALIDVRNTLQFANDSPGGGISDTIWMMHGSAPETLFDFIDAALAAPVSAPGDERYTCIGKGGEYAHVGVASGAGPLKGKAYHIYTDAKTGAMFARLPEDFWTRMERMSDAAPAAQAVEPAGQRAVGGLLTQEQMDRLDKIEAKAEAALAELAARTSAGQAAAGPVELSKAECETALRWLDVTRLYAFATPEDEALQSKLVAAPTVAAAGPLDIEAAAKAIYRLFAGSGPHPWVEGGNSDKQYLARKYARAALEASPSVAAAGPVASIGDDRKFMRLLLDCESARFGDIQPARDALIAHIEGYVRAKLAAAAGDAGSDAKDAAHAEEWSYSTDEEHYHDTEPSRVAIIQHALAEVEAGEEGASGFWIGKNKRFVGQIDAGWIIEQLQEQAHDECGEWAETYLEDVTKEEEAELESIVNAWAARVDRSNFWTVQDTEFITIEQAREIDRAAMASPVGAGDQGGEHA